MCCGGRTAWTAAALSPARPVQSQAGQWPSLCSMRGRSWMDTSSSDFPDAPAWASCLAWKFALVQQPSYWGGWRPAAAAMSSSRTGAVACLALLLMVILLGYRQAEGGNRELVPGSQIVTGMGPLPALLRERERLPTPCVGQGSFPQNLVSKY